MHILILGGGGREHALAWKIAQSPLVSRLSIAPGNGGTDDVAVAVALDPMDGPAVATWAKAEDVTLVVVGPEAPLAAGVADAVRAVGIDVFGPSGAAAKLESSKAFTKEVCDACGAPTAAWARFSDADTALAYVREQGAPIVIKADGLAAGKGVIVAETLAQAEDGVREIFSGAFGAAGAEVVIEEFMAGEEASFFVLTDGNAVLALATAQDHKRAFDGDQGPNTGGMGAYSPAPVMSPAIEAQVMEEIIRPTIAEMARRGTPFSGVLYAGVMIENARARLVEYNVRFGDPECQALMLRLASDVVPALHGAATGTLADVTLDWHDAPAMSVVMATAGYPGSYQKGDLIGGLDAGDADPDVVTFHAGTRKGPDGIEAAGGRVLNVTARGATIADARTKAYGMVDRIDWPGGFCRRDIGWRALD